MLEIKLRIFEYYNFLVLGLGLILFIIMICVK